MAPHIPKSSHPNGTSKIVYEDRIINLRHMYVVIDSTASQRDSQYYGPDAEHFDPTRWDASNDDSFLAKNKGKKGLMAVGLDYPTIHKPERGAFQAFSDGPRGCVGRKFGQVEFVAVISAILRDFRIELAVKDGSTWDQAANSAWNSLDRSNSSLALGVSEDIPMVLFRR